MKVGTLTQANQKGQIVIPKEMRENLGIERDSLLQLILRGKGIDVYPVEEIITRTKKEPSYVKVL